MLWTKGWLETRLLFLYALILFAAGLVPAYIQEMKAPLEARNILNNLLVIWVFFPSLLAGNGIRTPARFRASGDLHRSMYFTLSLPVTRCRLLAVRALVGLAETVAVVLAAVGAIWMFLPSFRTNVTPADTMLYILTLLVYTSGFYFLSVLLAVLIEGPWRVWGSFVLILGARWGIMHLPSHAFDILAPIAATAPILTHTLPWKALCVCTGLAALFFVVASKAIEAREN